MKLRDELALRKMVEEIDLVDEMLAGMSAEDFMADEVVKRAVGMSTINIGELAKHLSDGFLETHPNGDLVMAIRTRNVYAHGYYSLDFNDVYETAHDDFPALQQWVKDVLASEEASLSADGTE